MTAMTTAEPMPCVAPAMLRRADRRRLLRASRAALVVLGVGVRCRHYLAAPSYWYDEAYVLVNILEKSFAELHRRAALRLWAVGFVAVSQPAIFHTICVKPNSGDLLAAFWPVRAAAATRIPAASGRSSPVAPMTTAWGRDSRLAASSRQKDMI